MAAQDIGQQHYAALKTLKGLSAKTQILSFPFHRSSPGSFWAHSWAAEFDVPAQMCLLEQFLLSNGFLSDTIHPYPWKSDGHTTRCRQALPSPELCQH